MKPGTGLITLLSDFGEGLYSASMKGVILSAAPEARIIDICHVICPQNVLQAAIVLSGVAPTFPPQTLHCVVVDPGVGTERRIVLLEADGQVFLAPDNGCLTLVLRAALEKRKAEEDQAAGAGSQASGVTGASFPAELTRPPLRAWSVENEAYYRKPVSTTFHGRDVFAPVAGAIAAGERLEIFGPQIDPASLVTLSIPEPLTTADRIEGRITFVDRFGNLVSNIKASDIYRFGGAESLAVHFHGHVMSGLTATYKQALPGESLALIGSLGYLEVAVRGDSAAERFSAVQGDPIVVRRPPG